MSLFVVIFLILFLLALGHVLLILAVFVLILLFLILVMMRMFLPVIVGSSMMSMPLLRRFYFRIIFTGFFLMLVIF